jgi:hypothetical protein
MLSLEDLRKELVGMPPTWYPTLLETMLIESIRSRVWREGGLESFIRKVLDANGGCDVQV